MSEQVGAASTTVAAMILIPAGPFIMGSDVRKDEEPAGEIRVESFYLDRLPVTNAQFYAFWRAGLYDDPSHPCWAGLQEGYRWIRKSEERRGPRFAYDPQWNDPEQPVIGVTWYEALAYARWVGKRLPTEAEWEKAARGTDGRTYPWGNDFALTYCNVAQSGVGCTAKVGKYAPNGDSPYGISEMAGNIWEWTSTVYEPYPYRADDGREDLMENKGRRVLRGGSWQSRFSQHLRCANRYSAEANFGFTNTGFRCAKDG